MKCPDCQQILKPIDCKGVKIDECVKCKGKWFDRDELRKAKDRADDALRWLDFDPFGQDAEKLSLASEGKTCPKCSGKMPTLKYMDSKISIDKCSACQGVWLDPGEFSKIIIYLESKICNETVDGYLKDTFKQFIEIFKSREGVISEIKDFLALLYLLELKIAVEHPKLADTSKKIYEYVPFK